MNAITASTVFVLLIEGMQVKAQKSSTTTITTSGNIIKVFLAVRGLVGVLVQLRSDSSIQ